MNKGVLIATILGGAAIVVGVLVYYSSVKTASSIDNAANNTSDLNKLAGQVSSVLSGLGVKGE